MRWIFGVFTRNRWLPGWCI